eukprot:TRINITY_DN1800_c0_g1_i1.p1 TRINITY_DN1800_c0_g1~~TRINITY_DN1800_c0_g1_i1.p1  ORF type:complete len:100 (+),score=34.57 TRINITY_DN1800_c0_g1_i1:70-369(+)
MFFNRKKNRVDFHLIPKYQPVSKIGFLFGFFIGFSIPFFIINLETFREIKYLRLSWEDESLALDAKLASLKLSQIRSQLQQQPQLQPQPPQLQPQQPQL